MNEETPASPRPAPLRGPEPWATTRRATDQSRPVPLALAAASALAVSCLAHLAVNLLLMPGMPFMGFPSWVDDFRNLAYTAVRPAAVRPVSTMVLTALSALGPTSFFGALHVLDVTMVAAVMVFVAILLRVHDAWAFAAVALCVFSFEAIPFAYLYTGMITSLLSLLTGTLALTCFLLAFRDGMRPALLACLGGLLALLSILAKEDFILPLLIMAGYLGLPGVTPAPRRRRAVAVPAALALFGIGWVVFSAVVLHSHYVGAAATALRARAYHLDFSPGSVLATSARYLTWTRGATAVSIGSGLVLLTVSICGLRHRWREASFLAATAAALILPYAILPNHAQGYNCLNWLPWQAASIFVLAAAPLAGAWRGRRLALAGAPIALALVFVAVTAKPRMDVARYYAGLISTSLNVDATVRANRSSLEGSPVIAVVEPPRPNPWFCTDGAYLKARYGLRAKWLVFVPRDGVYYQTELALLGHPGLGDVEVHDIHELSALAGGLPVLRFTPDGHGTLSRSPGDA